MKHLTPRAVAAALVVMGLATGTLADEVPSRVPRRAGGYWMLAGDFHVHAFPGDGGLAPWSLRDEAARAGLDVFAVTNHNRVFTAHLARWVAGFSSGPIVLVGQEVTNPGYHLIALGIQERVNPDQPAAGAIAEVHAQGGVAIAAHPTRRYRTYDDTAIAELDGAEAAQSVVSATEPQDFADFFDLARRLNPTLAPIGSSDFHMTPMLANRRTWVFADEPTAAGVLDAIRRGTTVAVDEDGGLHGDAALTQIVTREGLAERVDAHPVVRRLAVALTWVGVLGVLVCRR